ncbi:phosphatase PAP2 family protein [Streptomyces sp. NBC_00536]|uniref:phosphatase PAP2 family protein n=1 Tax=Streptomyces sp. NBC_00536 TaxID=2975769 RepID=UPI002E81BFD9|nr:phosphatase PAP2 family protein [Streptomyces sp. NBC_00536]WUC77134.1 phosphatase PAP2 family protein [Streptomyces sp. NBC_00536]
MTRTGAARRAGWSAVASAALFALLTVWVVRAPQHLLPADAGLHRWSVGHRPAVAAALARALTDTGTGLIPYVLLLAAGWYAGRTTRQRALTAVALPLCLGAGQALRYGVMALVARPRPPAADWAAQASGWSFPSGHTATAAMTAGLLIAALLLRDARPPRTAVVLIALWGAAVGLTRVYLGVHWFSDVIGGWLFATAWLALLACAYLRRTGARPPAPVRPG